MKTALATLAIGEWEDVPEVHDPMKRFAKKTGMDFVKITKRENPELHIFYEKMQIQHLLRGKYDAVLYLDGDVLVTPAAIEDPVMATLYMSLKSLAFFNIRLRADFFGYSMCKESFILVGKEIPYHWDGRYYNLGVMWVPKKFVSLHDDPIATHMDYQDEAWINWKVCKYNQNYPVAQLTVKQNAMVLACLDVPWKESYFVHYASWKRCVKSLDEFRKLVGAYPFVPQPFIPQRDDTNKIPPIYWQYRQLEGKAAIFQKYPNNRLLRLAIEEEEKKRQGLI